MPDYPDPRYRLTPTRRAYLASLSDVGHREEPDSRAAFDCMVLQWTCYCYRDKEVGDFIDSDTARERYGEEIADWWGKVEKAGTMITKYGRDALERL